MKNKTCSVLYKFEIAIQNTLNELVCMYERFYDSHNWFIPNAIVSRILSYGDSFYQFILSLQVPLKNSKFFHKNKLQCYIIRSITHINKDHVVILEKNIDFKCSSAIKPSIKLFAVIS